MKGTAWVVAGIAALKLAVHLYAASSYGYFRDELYYLACSEHLDWGYVDQPPLIAFVARFVRMLFGDSLPAVRLLPALAGAVLVVLTALIARELGGRRFAQAFAALCVLLAPGFLVMDGFLSMNAFEPLFWTGCAYIVIRIIKTGDQRLWLWFGVLAGIGLENKHSMLIFGFGLIVGLLLTPERKAFRTPWIWIAGAIALLLILPNLVWNIRHHFPFLDVQASIRRSGRDVGLGPLAFFGQQLLTMLPLSAPVWLAGLWYYFFDADGKRFRALGWAWLITAGAIVAMSPRVYYLWPAYPMLFAAGAVFCESRPWLRWIKSPAYVAAMIAVAALVAPTVLPLLPVETYIRYSQAIHFAPPKIETHKLGPLPQVFADEFGWEEMAATIARVYHRLPPEVQTRTAIYGQNYGEAGAVDLFGPKYGLPKAICGHQNYFYWGPRGYTGESVIVMRGRQEELEKQFARVEKVARVEHPYSMPYEHFDVYYCQGLRESLAELWPKVKSWR